MDKDVSAPGELDETVRSRSVSRYDDGSIAGVKPIAECRSDGWMVHDRSRYRDVPIFHDAAALAQLVDMNQRNERHPPLVGDAAADVRPIHLEEQCGHDPANRPSHSRAAWRVSKTPKWFRSCSSATISPNRLLT